MRTPLTNRGGCRRFARMLSYRTTKVRFKLVEPPPLRSPMDPFDRFGPLPDLHPVQRRDALQALRLAALEALVAYLAHHLSDAPVPHPTALEDFSLRHLAKATGTTRSALLLMRDRCWTDAC